MKTCLVESGFATAEPFARRSKDERGALQPSSFAIFLTRSIHYRLVIFCWNSVLEDKFSKNETTHSDFFAFRCAGSPGLGRGEDDDSSRIRRRSDPSGGFVLRRFSSGSWFAGSEGDRDTPSVFRDRLSGCPAGKNRSQFDGAGSRDGPGADLRSELRG